MKVGIVRVQRQVEVSKPQILRVFCRNSWSSREIRNKYSYSLIKQVFHLQYDETDADDHDRIQKYLHLIKYQSTIVVNALLKFHYAYRV